MRFAQLLEQTPDWHAARSDWQWRLGSEFALIEPLLQATGNPAQNIGSLEGMPGPWDVIQYPTGEFGTVHQATRECGPHIDREDAELLTIDPWMLRATLRRVLMLDEIASDFNGWPGVITLGSTRHSKVAARRVVCLVSGYSCTQVQRIAITHVAPMTQAPIVVVPTTASNSPSLGELARRAGGSVVSLQDCLFSEGVGLQAAPSWAEVIRVAGTHQHASAPAKCRRRRAYPESTQSAIKKHLNEVIKQRLGGLEEARRVGKTYRPGPLTQEMVAKNTGRNPSDISRLFSRPYGATLKQLFENAKDMEFISRLLEARDHKTLKAKQRSSGAHD